jgi:hypothetical protein
VSPRQLLLLLTAAAPTAEHAVHAACLCYAVAAAQEGGAGAGTGALATYLPWAAALLELLTPEGAPRGGGGASPLAEAFLSWRAPGGAASAALAAGRADANDAAWVAALCGGGGGAAAAARAHEAAAAGGAPAPAPAPRLVPLPHRFDDLLAGVSGVQCGRCGRLPEEPALCLACGALVCAGGAPADQAGCGCKQLPTDMRAYAADALACAPAALDARLRGTVGECTAHAGECGGGVGVFLLLGKNKSSAVLLATGGQAAYYGSPYVDAHGEEDVNLRRGKPLTLCPRRYAALTALWATGGVAREALAVRAREERLLFFGYY